MGLHIIRFHLSNQAERRLFVNYSAV